MSQDSSSSSSEDLDTRPNRWKGAASTWKKYTEEERGLAASLDQIRNADLSIHLYNAHALKLRAIEYKNDPETARVNKEHPAIATAEHRTYLPPKTWTAWPLPSEDLPRKEDDNGYHDGYDAFTFKKKEILWPSRELEEELMGVTLKLARDRFESRDSESEDDSEGHDMSPQTNNLIFAEELHVDESAHQQNIKEEPTSTTRLKPIVSVDDDKSRELLRPSIRHTLSKLDEVLMALHHARKIARRYSQSEDGTADEERPEREGSTSAAPKSRPRGRPRNFADLPDRTRAGHTQVAGAGDVGLFRVKTARRGRPLKTYEPLPGESEQEYLIRIAKLQKKPLPVFAAPQEAVESPSPRLKKSKSPSKRATTEELNISRQKKLGLRDWSEVLGAAALVGFAPDVIARATQRCVKLFDEGMEMMQLPEIPYSEKEAVTVTRYVPDMIPDYESARGEDSNTSDLTSSDPESRQKREFLKRNISTSRKPPRGSTKFLCTVSDCPRKTKGFRDIYSLKRHFCKNHKIPADEVNDYILLSDEEMDGAVHVDGFLKPIPTVVLGKRHPGKKQTRNPGELGDSGEVFEHNQTAAPGQAELREDSEDEAGE